MQQVLRKLQKQFPELQFSPGDQFCWSPETAEIFYATQPVGTEAVWSLLHETGHALLEHKSYQADFELLRLEVDAWEQARALAIDHGISIDEDHIQDCLDTYRDWLYKRSICPTCRTKCLQEDNHSYYHCFNCHTSWRVTSSRFCRAYRSIKNVLPSTVLIA
jgi:hypothetical protein